ncbi:hypothetical protein BH20VER2_BH20VER2_13090 [soil metagenome]|nr:hypothetical protein [Chthoniobacterales bacterium]
MRALVASLVFVVGFAVSALAQEQERKLLDRVLKPDMSLQNPVQEKQFRGGGSVTIKEARTKSFLFFKRRPKEKEFPAGTFHAQEFAGTRVSRSQGAVANVATRRRIPKADVPYSTAAFTAVRGAHDAEKKAVDVSEFSGTRPFLGRGKSQKALSQQDRPLTIDQVRELLNKNK